MKGVQLYARLSTPTIGQQTNIVGVMTWLGVRPPIKATLLEYLRLFHSFSSWLALIGGLHEVQNKGKLVRTWPGIILWALVTPPFILNL